MKLATKPAEVKRRAEIASVPGKAVSRTAEANFDALVAASRAAAAALPRLPDAYFDALSAPDEEWRRQHQSPEQRLERANAEAYAQHVLRWHGAEQDKTKSENANLIKDHLTALRWQAIVDFWPTASEQRNSDKRNDAIRDHLKALRPKEKLFAISERTLLSNDLPALRKMGLISR